MCCFRSEFALHLLNKIQMADRNRLRPVSLSHHSFKAERLSYQLPMRLLKIRNTIESTQ
jgi:hypothetical protein